MNMKIFESVTKIFLIKNKLKIKLKVPNIMKSKSKREFQEHALIKFAIIQWKVISILWAEQNEGKSVCENKLLVWGVFI